LYMEDKIVVDLSKVRDSVLLSAIEFANKCRSKSMAVHNRSRKDKMDEILRGMFCEELIISLKVIPSLSRNTDLNPRAPEYVDEDGNTWDMKITTRKVEPRPEFNCPYCKENVEKDGAIGLYGYIVGTFLIPCPARARHYFTTQIFRDKDLRLLKRCKIILSGFITHKEFMEKGVVILKGEDLNRGEGHVQIAKYNNIVCRISDLHPFSEWKRKTRQLKLDTKGL